MRKTLPEKYYLEHFHEFIGFFDGASRALLNAHVRRFISDFRSLSEDAQCIVARAANRKYALINRSHFNYDEINRPQDQINKLIENGWFGDIREASPQDVAAVMTKADLQRCLEECGVTAKLRSATKPQLVTLLFRQINQYGWPEQHSLTHLLVSRFNPSLRFLLFLYFGNTKGRLNQFSMRDLGIMRTRADSASEQARFESAKDANSAFYYATRLDSLPFLDESELCQACNDSHPPTDSVLAQQYAEKYLFKLASQTLPIDRPAGINLLGRAPGDAAKEKWLREVYKEGDKETVKSALEAIIDSPASDTLLAFAEDFYQRKFNKKRTSVVTDMLRNAKRTLAIDESQNQSVEQGVIAWHRRQGAQGWRTENRLWRSLFALTFWQLLFEDDGLVTEFDRRPQSLRQNDFYTRFGRKIEALLASMTDNSTLMKHVTAMAGKHYGISNSLFLWSPQLLEPISVLLSNSSKEVVHRFLRMMCEDFASLRDGFPDIMVLENGRLRFEEVKAPGDQLRRNQLVSIQKLQQAGFDVQVTQVNWVRDPYQPYAVVDIETTGGNSQYHRITEVGIVKMIDGKVVEEWQSLINPQRRIPASITRLTGISNDMVADAPIFADVAQQIDNFTQDCVFVAHNVNFDYGFLRQEFARLEQVFRRPKICTVREMRKAKPGLPSYSLAALTETFDIQMERHHRALSDARAAAELLVQARQ